MGGYLVIALMGVIDGLQAATTRTNLRSTFEQRTRASTPSHFEQALASRHLFSRCWPFSQYMRYVRLPRDAVVAMDLRSVSMQRPQLWLNKKRVFPRAR